MKTIIGILIISSMIMMIAISQPCSPQQELEALRQENQTLKQELQRSDLLIGEYTRYIKRVDQTNADIRARLDVFINDLKKINCECSELDSLLVRYNISGNE